jgi:mono/diheme cytochrome c family protein
MKGKFVFILAMSALLGLSYFALSSGADQAQMPENVKSILKQNCSLSVCHSGKNASAGLNLEPANLPASVVGVSSREKPDLKIVDPAAPEKSYLLAKIKGEPGIMGKRMPANRNPLTEEEIRQVEEWITSLKVSALF